MIQQIPSEALQSPEHLFVWVIGEELKNPYYAYRAAKAYLLYVRICKLFHRTPL